MLLDVSDHIDPQKLTLLLVLGVLYHILRQGSSYLRLRHFPGPRGSGVSEFPHIRAFLSGKCHEWYAEVSKKYGPLARVSPNILLTSSTDLYVRMNMNGDYKRSKWFYEAAQFDWRRPDLFTQKDMAIHDAKKKKMIPGYSGRENLELEPDIDCCMTAFIQLIRKTYASSNSASSVPKPLLDLAQKLQFLTLDVISLIGFGTSFDLLKHDSDTGQYVKSTAEGLRRINFLMALGLYWIHRLPLIGQTDTPSVENSKGMERLVAVSGAIVESRERAFHEDPTCTQARSDMLASFMRNGLAGDELKTEALLQIIAGSDTTGGAMRGSMLYILSNPRVYKKLQAEVDEAVAKGDAPRDGIISYAETRRLPYLQAVVRECIRIFPPLADPLGRDVPPGGDTVTIDGRDVFLPGGTSIIPSWVAIHRDAKLYGEDAHLFRPERWLEEADAEKLDAMKKTNDLMFGIGRYSCPGKPVAMIEIHKAVFEMLRHFDWALVAPETPWRHSSYMGLRVISDMWVQATDRFT